MVTSLIAAEASCDASCPTTLPSGPMKLNIIDRMAVIHGAASPRGNCGSFHGKNVVAMLLIRLV
jgi:hypothetical protein